MEYSIPIPILPVNKDLFPCQHLISLESFNSSIKEITFNYCKAVNGAIDESQSFTSTCSLNKWMNIE